MSGRKVKQGLMSDGIKSIYMTAAAAAKSLQSCSTLCNPSNDTEMNIKTWSE